MDCCGERVRLTNIYHILLFTGLFGVTRVTVFVNDNNNAAHYFIICITYFNVHITNKL